MDKYAEPPAVSQELFNKLDVVFLTQTKDGVLTIEDIVTAYKSISLFPPLSEVKKMFHELGTNFLTYEQFRSMRSSIHRCELNALAEFKKYESRKSAKGMVTIDSVKRVRFIQEHR
jgi:Ca2+-binding EF-hand superfamily protein